MFRTCWTLTEHQTFVIQNGVVLPSYDCGTLQLDFEYATALPGFKLVCQKMALKEDDALSRIKAHLQEKM